MKKLIALILSLALCFSSSLMMVVSYAKNGGPGQGHGSNPTHIHLTQDFSGEIYVFVNSSLNGHSSFKTLGSGAGQVALPSGTAAPAGTAGVLVTTRQNAKMYNVASDDMHQLVNSGILGAVLVTNGTSATYLAGSGLKLGEEGQRRSTATSTCTRPCVSPSTVCIPSPRETTPRAWAPARSKSWPTAPSPFSVPTTTAPSVSNRATWCSSPTIPTTPNIKICATVSTCPPAPALSGMC